MKETQLAVSLEIENGASRFEGMTFDGARADGAKPDGMRLDGASLRASLRQLAETREFLGSPEGNEFLRQLEQYLAPGVRAAARRLGLGEDWAQPLEIVHTLIVGLCADGGKAATHIAETAIDPWAYLARCSIKWSRELWGSRGISLEQVSESRVEVGLMAQRNPDPDDRLTSLARVVELTHRALAPHTPLSLGRPLGGLLSWLANNPPQRVSHETADRAAASRAFRQFTPPQLAAVVNVAWGGRPRRRETSLLAAFLVNPDFRPSDSPTHARALLQYRRAMRSQLAFEEPARRMAA